MKAFVSIADMEKGCLGDMIALGITESYKVKRQALVSAAEAAEMILRVDDIIKAAPRYSLVAFVVGRHIRSYAPLQSFTKILRLHRFSAPSPDKAMLWV